MHTNVKYLLYSDTHSFSPLVTDYLSNADSLRSFYKYGTGKEDMAKAIEDRAAYPVNRKLLQQVLNRQYEHLTVHEKVANNLELIALDNCFTVCTAHQPNLMTGYLYFVYKILHAVRLSEELNNLHPDKYFVPVYYMGSEDNDLEELGTFRYNGQKFKWVAGGQTGAVGRMSTKTLKGLIGELYKLLGPPGANYEQLKQLLTEAYLNHSNISDATQYLVNELFGQYGLLVLNPDEQLLKTQFIPVMEDELLHQKAHEVVSKDITLLAEHYKVQAHPRQINLFYLEDQIRERIEKTAGGWAVVNTNIRWDEAGIIKELHEHPERFSPNVILRGLYQETILPNVAFIGGGAEVAYWLQLKNVFEHYHIYFPSVHLRQSVLWIDSLSKKLHEQLGLDIPDIFLPETELVKRFVLENGSDDWQTGEEMKAIETTLHELKRKATSLDPTLKASAEAALAKIRHQVQVLEKKMFRAKKRKLQTQLPRIAKLKSLLFPNGGLQERVENFIPYYLQYGQAFFDILKTNMEPFRHEFLVIEEEN